MQTLSITLFMPADNVFTITTIQLTLNENQHFNLPLNLVQDDNNF